MHFHELCHRYDGGRQGLDNVTLVEKPKTCPRYVSPKKGSPLYKDFCDFGAELVIICGEGFRKKRWVLRLWAIWESARGPGQLEDALLYIKHQSDPRRKRDSHKINNPGAYMCRAIEEIERDVENRRQANQETLETTETEEENNE